MKPRILIVDDEEDIRNLLKEILEEEGFQTFCAAHSEETELILSKHLGSIDLAILDIWLENSDKDGIQLLEDIKSQASDLPVLMISGHGNVETAVQSIKKGAYDFIEKPFKTDRLLLTINRALEVSALRQENSALKENKSHSKHELIGGSSAVSQLQAELDRVAPSESRVFISGEAGSGKDMLARLLHKKSKRFDKPYLALNCATLNPERIEAELFGEKLTSSDFHTQGLLEKADGGTLFLDQVADMPIETQGKIVRVLQEQRFRPVGSIEEITVNVRIIAASSRDIRKMIDEGHFREDLYYRLNVVPLYMPNLRERVQDIPDLAQFFMNKSAKAEGLKPKKLDLKLLSALQHMRWPGNVRQLKNVLEWMLIMYADIEDTHLSLKHLPTEFQNTSSDAFDQISEFGMQSNFSEALNLPLKEARNAFEKEYLESQLTKFNGNVSKTADFIGMERSALHRKLKSLGLDQAKTGS